MDNFWILNISFFYNEFDLFFNDLSCTVVPKHFIAKIHKHQAVNKISFSLYWPTGLIQSRCTSVTCPHLETLFAGGLENFGRRVYRKYWNTSRRFHVCVWLDDFLIFFWVFANEPTVHKGGVSRGRVCGCGSWCWEAL